MREQQLCIVKDMEVESFRSCKKNQEESSLPVVTFQVIMAIAGTLAFWGVQIRKKYTMSEFDSRRGRS
jgi:hypothetical protein